VEGRLDSEGINQVAPILDRTVAIKASVSRFHKLKNDRPVQDVALLLILLRDRPVWYHVSSQVQRCCLSSFFCFSESATIPQALLASRYLAESHSMDEIYTVGASAIWKEIDGGELVLRLERETHI